MGSRSIILAILLLGCMTPYQSMSYLGGYDDEYLGDDIYLITVRVNGYTDVTTAYKYFYKRAGEIIEEHGYTRYELLELEQSTKIGIVSTNQRIRTSSKPRIFGRIKCYSEPDENEAP